MSPKGHIPTSKLRSNQKLARDGRAIVYLIANDE